MRKKLFNLAFLLLVVVFVVSGCGEKNNNAPAAEINSPSASEQNGQTEDLAGSQLANEEINPSGTYTINELLAMNRPMKCSWIESITAGDDVTNIIYINGKKFYQDVTMGDIGHAYTVSDGEYLYIWNDFTDVASKMKFSEMEKQAQNNNQTPGASTTAGLGQHRDFVCDNWLVDNSVFNPPADKDFKDITEEMGEALNDIQENSAEYLKQACDLCKQAPTQELRDSCMGEMQCD
jgi:outer membrane lipoprotein-sorting protein